MKISLGKIELTVKRSRNSQKKTLPSWYIEDYKKFKALLGDNLEFPIIDSNPQLCDKDANCATLPAHYFLQDLTIAQKIHNKNPKKHVDIGSRIDGFVSHVASFREIEVLDIRPLDMQIPNVRFKQVDIMDEQHLPKNYCDSLSCLHAIEHFGLGRYGDPIDPYGHVKGFHNMTQILQPRGTMYLSAPIGPQHIEFNAHRVFNLGYLVQMIDPLYTIKSFSYINDQGILVKDSLENPELLKNSLGCNFGCALFELIKK